MSSPGWTDATADLILFQYRQDVLHAVADVHDDDCSDADPARIWLGAQALIRGDYSGTVNSGRQQESIAQALQSLTANTAGAKLG